MPHMSRFQPGRIRPRSAGTRRARCRGHSGDRLANNNTHPAVADKAVLAAVTERRGRTLDAVVVAVDALLIVEELSVKASQAPAVVC